MFAVFAHIVSKVYKYAAQSLDLVTSFLHPFRYTFLYWKFVGTSQFTLVSTEYIWRKHSSMAFSVFFSS